MLWMFNFVAIMGFKFCNVNLILITNGLRVVFSLVLRLDLEHRLD